MPCLCAAGLITHACDCSESDGHRHDSDGDHDSGCRHEGDCVEDPCRKVIMRPERQNDDPVLTRHGPPPCPPVIDDAAVRVAATGESWLVRRLDCTNLPIREKTSASWIAEGLRSHGGVGRADSTPKPATVNKAQCARRRRSLHGESL